MRGTLSGCLALTAAFYLTVGCRKAEVKHGDQKLDFAKASGAHDDAEMGDVDGGEELERWAKQDWLRVEPVLTRMAAGTEPRTATLAQTLLYERLLHSGDQKAAAGARERLRKTAEDRKALGYCRARATETLLSAKWDGRDEWYLSLFKDDTIRYLHDGFELHIPLQGPVARDPDHWIPIMTKLVGSANEAIHNSAVACLVQFNLKGARRDALKPLLPWLLDRKWSSAGDRLRLIQSMDELDLKESVPGLIAVLGEDGDTDDRSYAAEALGHFKDPRAVPALREALIDERHQDRGSRIIQGLLNCGGISAREAALNVEAYLTFISTPDGKKQWEAYQSWKGAAVRADLAIGGWIAEQGPPDATTVPLLAARADELRGSRPTLAGAIRTTMASWPLDGADRETLREIRAGSATKQAIEATLEKRAAIRKTLGDELRSLEQFSGPVGAIGALLLGDGAREQVILRDPQNAEGQKTLLTYGRQIREKLPVAEVGKLWDSRDNGIAEAAGKYLETEDSPKARRLYLSRHKGEALILGLRMNGDPGHFSFQAFDEIEERLRDQVKNEGGVEIYGLLTAGYWGNAGQILVRKSGTKSEIQFIEDRARYYSRQLSDTESAQLEQFVRDRKVEDLGPFESEASDGMQYEYVHIAKDGGRRVFMNNPGLEGANDYTKVCDFFVKLAAASHLTLHYRETANLPGFEILLADQRLIAGTVWAHGPDLRVLAAFPDQRRTNGRTMEDNGEWHVNGKHIAANWSGWMRWQDQRLTPGEKPGDFPDANPNQNVPEQIEKGVLENGGGDELWRLTVAGKTYRTTTVDGRTGLWEFSSGVQPRLVRDGKFASPVLTPDGRFAFVAEHKGGSWAEPNFVSRIDVRTGRTMTVKVAPADRVRPVAYVAARNGVLVARWKELLGPDTAEYWLVNPDGGEARRVEGEFSPLDDEGLRPLQGAGRKNMVWAAITSVKENATRVGRYDLASFRLIQVLRIPGLQFRSDAMWVDEVAHKLDVCYRGQLLRMDIGNSE